MIVTSRVTKVAASAVLIAGMGLAACQTNKQTIGAGIGAASGVAIGSAIGAGGGRTAAMIVGGLLGGLIGSEIGRTMDENDRLRAYQSTQYALESNPTGNAATWTNPDTGYSGSTVPGRPYNGPSGDVCREYTQTIRVDGRSETATGVACRQSDGTWRILNS